MLPGRWRPAPLVVIGASTAMLVHLAWSLLAPGARSIGQDYSYFFPYLVAGPNWVRTNGWLAPPHFTPDFCGGLPWLANPQSLFYSVPQLLATVTDPVAAARWTLIIFATGGAAATFLLLRRCLGAS